MMEAEQSELQTCVRVLQQLAGDAELFDSPQCKPLRTALIPLLQRMRARLPALARGTTHTIAHTALGAMARCHTRPVARPSAPTVASVARPITPLGFARSFLRASRWAFVSGTWRAQKRAFRRKPARGKRANKEARKRGREVLGLGRFSERHHQQPRRVVRRGVDASEEVEAHRQHKDDERKGEQRLHDARREKTMKERRRKERKG